MMATRKTPKTSQKIAKKTVGKAKKALRAAPSRATAKTAKQRAVQYAAPGAAVLGSGIVAAAGILLRDELGQILATAARSVMSGGVAARNMASKELDFERLLSHVGLQRRRMPFFGVSVGALAGIAAGSALVLWLGPRVKEALKATKPMEPTVPRPEPVVERRVVTQNGAP
jgi:hypothetical protein